MVVHGGGPQIEQALNRLGKKGRVHPAGHARDGRRDHGGGQWVLAGEVQQVYRGPDPPRTRAARPWA